MTEDQVYIGNKLKSLLNADIDYEIRLQSFLPEPENKGLKHIWRYGACDIVARKYGRAFVVEPGGGQHFTKKQSMNDRRKWKLLDINNIPCFHIMNGTFQRMSNRQIRQMIYSKLLI